MNVIRHNNGRNHGHALAVEVSEGFCHDLCALRLSQETGAVSRIEPPFHGPGKSPMIFELDFQIPRLGMQTEPRFTFVLPSTKQLGRHRIRETKRNEINCAFLLPMRQTISRVLDFGVWIEEAQLVHLGENGLMLCQSSRVVKPQGTAVYKPPTKTWGGLESAPPW